MKKRMLKVALPSQLFSIFLLLIFGLKELKSTIIVLLNFQGIGFLADTHLFEVSHNMSHTWFVTVILLCYMSTPFLQRCKNSGNLNGIYLIVLWLIVLFLPYAGLYLGNIALFISAYYVAANDYLCRYNLLKIIAVIVFAIAMRIGGRFLFDGTVLYNSDISMVSHTLLSTGILLLIREIYLKYASMVRINQLRTFSFIEKYSYYIYISHYCLIPLTYMKYGVWISTLAFLVGTAILSVCLKFVHNQTEKIIISKCQKVKEREKS